MNKKKISADYERRYGHAPTFVVSAPGRVNIIGEHTDYNDGFVLPMAIDRRIWVAARTLKVDTIRLSSDNQVESVEVTGTIHRQGNWADYPLGVISTIRSENCACGGYELHFSGNVPLGGGLSSSAAIEVATATVVNELCDLGLAGKDIARLCQSAENSFVGMRCGAMDQMASALCVKDHALFIDCRDLGFEQVPLETGRFRVAIINSGVSRELAASGYNARRAECESAAVKLGVKSLRDVSPKDLARIEKLDDPIGRRARHVVTENARVLDAVKFLKAGDLKSFGRLMTESHRSLAKDYEVSAPELDWLVERTIEKGALGARLTGAGFGGCMIALADENIIHSFEEMVLKPYSAKFKRVPELIVAEPDDGARIE